MTVIVAPFVITLPLPVGLVADFAIDVLGDIVGVGGDLENTVVNLGTGTETPLPSWSNLTPVVIPTWTGYADEALTWNATVSDGLGGAIVEGDSVNWISNADADEVLTMVALNVGNNLRGVYVLPVPIPVVGAMSITVIPYIRIKQA